MKQYKAKGYCHFCGAPAINTRLWAEDDEGTEFKVYYICEDCEWLISMLLSESGMQYFNDIKGVSYYVHKWLTILQCRLQEMLFYSDTFDVNNLQYQKLLKVINEALLEFDIKDIIELSEGREHNYIVT